MSQQGKILLKKDNEITVLELIKALHGCRADVPVFTSLFSHTGLNRIRVVKDCGNYVSLIQEKD